LAFLILKSRDGVPALLLSPGSNRNVVPLLLLGRQHRDDVAVADGGPAATSLKLAFGAHLFSAWGCLRPSRRMSPECRRAADDRSALGGARAA